MRYAARIQEKRLTTDTVKLVLVPNPESARVRDGKDLPLPDLLTLTASGDRADEWRYMDPGDAIAIDIGKDWLADEKPKRDAIAPAPVPSAKDDEADHILAEPAF